MDNEQQVLVMQRRFTRMESLRDVRKSCEMTIGQLSEESGISKHIISTCERGTNYSITAIDLFSLCCALQKKSRTTRCKGFFDGNKNFGFSDFYDFYRSSIARKDLGLKP